MPRVYTDLCDRCGATVSRGVVRVAVESGPSRHRLFAPVLYLCEVCKDDFSSFMEERKDQRESAVVATLDDDNSLEAQ